MKPPLTPAGYVQTKEKLARMEARLAALRLRTDLDPRHREDVQQSYEDMMCQYLRDVLLFEERQVGNEPT